MKFLHTAAALFCCVMALPSWAADFGRIRADEIAVYVQELDSGKVLVQHRADAPVNPASTMKLMTAFTAFQVLGGDYRWHTQLKSNGCIEGDTLVGDIYWVGSGDPSLEQDNLIALQQQLQRRGIRKISGNLVLDRSLWGSVANPPEFASDAAESFMTAPDPNMLAYKVVWLKPERNPLGDIEIVTNPPLPEIALDNRLTLTDSAAECKSLSRHLRAGYAGGKITVTGKLPSSCLGEETFVNMLDVKTFAQKSFINQWRAAGGEISDGLKVAAAPADAAVLAEVASKPLSAVLADMNKHSNNLIARSVFLTLGRHADDEAAAREAAAVMRRELTLAGVETEPLMLENGSGLSRKERVSAKMMAQMLEKAYFSPFKQAFIDSLPIAGTDGTLKTRFKQAGQPLRLKTGTLKDVRALAGYWLGEKPLVVVVIVNSPKATEYLKDLDKWVSQTVLPGGESWIDARLSCQLRQVA